MKNILVKYLIILIVCVAMFTLLVGQGLDGVLIAQVMTASAIILGIVISKQDVSKEESRK